MGGRLLLMTIGFVSVFMACRQSIAPTDLASPKEAGSSSAPMKLVIHRGQTSTEIAPNDPQREQIEEIVEQIVMHLVP